MKYIRKILLCFLLLTLLFTCAGAKSSVTPGGMTLIGWATQSKSVLDKLKVKWDIPVCKAGEPTVTVTAKLTGLPKKFSQEAKLTWLVDGIPWLTEDIVLKNDVQVQFTLSTVFSEDMPEKRAVTLRILCGDRTVEETAEVKLENFPASHYERLAKEKRPYRLEVVRSQNVVLVWAKDEEGNYSILQNAFLCSTGGATMTGTYTTGEYHPWRALFGNAATNYRYVYGQCSVRIHGNILFHTVPYFTMNKGDLEYEEYNKLGTKASMGCVRLTAEAEIWLYEHCPAGTTVCLYDSDTLPVSRPAAPKIDPESPNRGWDPTDPDPDNPWKRVE